MLLSLLILGLIGIFLINRRMISISNPIKWFNYIWIIQLTIAFIFSDKLMLKYSGLVFIEIACISSIIGVWLGYLTINYAGNKKNLSPLALNKKRIYPLLYILLMLGILNPLMTLYKSGFSLAIFLNFDAMLEANSTIANDRYTSGGPEKSALSQILLTFTYLAPLYGGYVVKKINKGRWLCYLTILPGIFTAITQAVKMNLVSAIFLFLAGQFTYYCYYHIQFGIFSFRNCIKIALGGSLIASVLFGSMILRYGKFEQGTLSFVGEKIVGYSVGQIPAFDQWYHKDNPPQYSLGGMTLAGIYNPLGLTKRVQGAYQDTYPVWTKDQGSTTNIYTVFRFLIDDFGAWGAILAITILGWFATINTSLVARHVCPYVSQTVQMGIWAFVLWSFATSYFAYTSYIAVLIFMGIILKFITIPNAKAITVKA